MIETRGVFVFADTREITEFRVNAAGNDVYRLTVAGQSQRIVVTGLFAQADKAFVGGWEYQTAVMDKAGIVGACLLELNKTEV